MTDWLDDDGYPTDAACERITEWADGWSDLLEFVRGLWHFGDWGWDEADEVDDFRGAVRRYRVTTGGWSGNEDLIRALMANRMFWSLCWVQSNRSGHHIFEVKCD